MSTTKYFLTFQTVFILNQNIKWMDEYIKYYINLGVEHFYLYDNEGTSGMDFTTHTTNRRQFVTRNNTEEDLEKNVKLTSMSCLTLLTHNSMNNTLKKIRSLKTCSSP